VAARIAEEPPQFFAVAAAVDSDLRTAPVVAIVTADSRRLDSPPGERRRAAPDGETRRPRRGAKMPAVDIRIGPSFGETFPGFPGSKSRFARGPKST
jgi:hypothetical protein